MRKLIGVVALAMMAGLAGAQAQSFPSRQITLVVPFPPGGSTDVAARIMAEKMRPILGQPVIIEKPGRRRRQHRGRARRTRGAGRLHHRHRPVGHPRRQHHLQSELRSAEGLRAARADLGQSAAPGRQEKPAGEQAQRTRDLDEGQSGRRQVRQPERRGGDLRSAAAAAHRHQADLHSLSRRGSGDDRPGIGPGRSPGGAGRGDAAANPRRHDQGDRQSVAATLGVDARHSDLGRDRRAGTLHVRDGSGSGRRRARRRTSSPSSTAR